VKQNAHQVYVTHIASPPAVRQLNRPKRTIKLTNCLRKNDI